MLRELLIIAQLAIFHPTDDSGYTEWNCGTDTAVSGNHNLTLSEGALTLSGTDLGVEFSDGGFPVPMDFSGDYIPVEMPTYPSQKHFRLKNPLPRPEDIIRHCHSSWWRCENEEGSETVGIQE